MQISQRKQRHVFKAGDLLFKPAGIYKSLNDFSVPCVVWEEKLLPTAGWESGVNKLPQPPSTSFLLKASFLFNPMSRLGEILQKERARDSTRRVLSEGKVVQAGHSPLKVFLPKKMSAEDFESNWVSSSTGQELGGVQKHQAQQSGKAALIHRVGGTVRQRELEWKEFYFL